MRPLRIWQSATAALLLMLSPGQIAAQAVQQSYLPGRAVSEVNPMPVKSMCWSGSTFATCPTTGSVSASTSDATAANQAAQISVEQSIRDQIGARTSPAAGSTNALIAATNSLLSLPLAISTHPVTQSGTWTVGISGTPTVLVGNTVPVTASALPLPAGAATDASTVAVSTNLNAGLLTREEAKVWNGFGFTVSTAVVAVSAGNYLSVELANPAGSGVSYVMTSRVLSSNVVGGAAPLEYIRYAPTATFPATTATSVTINNRLTGGPASTGTFRYTMGASLPTGTASSSGFIPTGGQEKRIKDVIILAPGTKLIYAVGGAGGGLAAMARVSVTFLFYTNPA
jgi:hypothetical protein